MRPKASATQVRGPPFLKTLPFAEAITTGGVAFRVSTVGPATAFGAAAAATDTTAPALTNSRRLTPRPMVSPSGVRPAPDEAAVYLGRGRISGCATVPGSHTHKETG